VSRSLAVPSPKRLEAILYGGLLVMILLIVSCLFFLAAATEGCPPYLKNSSSSSGDLDSVRATNIPGLLASKHVHFFAPVYSEREYIDDLHDTLEQKLER
jgi:hypothetical protein